MTEGKDNPAAAQAFLRALPEGDFHGISETNYTLPKRFEALIVRTILSGYYTLNGDSLHRVDWTDEERIWKLLNGNIAGKYDEQSARSLWVEIKQTCECRTILALEERTIALGPADTEMGDMICILHGSKVPIALRPRAISGVL